MSDEDWDAEDYEPTIPVKAAAISDKWEGEDEEEPIKESWDDDEDEEKKGDEKKETTQVQKKKPQKKLEEKIAERKAKEAEERRKREEDARLANMTPEEKLAEKLRRQKLQEDADLELARETFDKSANCISESESSINANPTTKEEFAEFRKELLRKFGDLQSREPYKEFVEEFVKELCAGLDVEVLKKISNLTKSIFEEKQKMAKSTTKPAKKGAKGKAALKMDKANDYYDEYAGGEYDDFM
nr:EOG090X0OQM [Eulimnadia texana]